MKVPALQRVKRGGRYIGAYYVWVKGVRVNLRTQDALEAQRRARRAAKGEKKFTPDASMERHARSVEDLPASDGAADALLAAVRREAPTSNPGPQESPPPPAPSPVAADTGPAIEPEIVQPGDPDAHPAQPPAGPWTDAVRDSAAAAPAATEAPRPVIDPEITNAELAKLGVEAQLWAAKTYAQQKVWKGFVPPQVPQEAREPLIAEWKKILAYCDVQSMMPPWVMGLLVPAVTLVTATTALAYAFAEMAKEQKKQAGADDDQPTGQQGLAAA